MIKGKWLLMIVFNSHRRKKLTGERTHPDIWIHASDSYHVWFFVQIPFPWQCRTFCVWIMTSLLEPTAWSDGEFGSIFHCVFMQREARLLKPFSHINLHNLCRIRACICVMMFFHTCNTFEDCLCQSGLIYENTPLGSGEGQYMM